jgi:hypothetical protein
MMTSPSVPTRDHPASNRRGQEKVADSLATSVQNVCLRILFSLECNVTFDFYLIEEGEFGEPQLRKLPHASIEAFPEDAIAAVNKRFQELVDNSTSKCSVVVISPTIGQPSGAIVAAELVHAQTAETRTRQGKPVRELRWVVDKESTGIA